MSSGLSRSKRLAFRFCLFALIAIAIGLRIVDLRSDPYAKLDWDTGILTDEGFYTHNARNVVLFGHARQDEFNNMLVSPLVHYLQIGVFSLFGFGVVQARMISVVLSILTLVPFLAALKLAFGLRIAVTATVFLALDHVNVLFNRMALLDTPAAFLAVLAFYAFVRGVVEIERGSAETASAARRQIWFAVCGALLGLTVITRPLCAYLLPAPFIALWLVHRGSASVSWMKQPGANTAFGILLVAAVYFVVWYLPNAAELNHMSHYYRTVQIQPHSFGRLIHNVYIAIFGGEYGIFPYLSRHTPATLLLALLGIGATLTLGRKRPQAASVPDPITIPSVVERASASFLAAWIILGCTILAISNYSPDRYFVSLLPPLYALAAIGLWRLPKILTGIRTQTALSIVGAIFGAWFLINAWWLTDWWRHREYTQIAMTDWLNRNMPADSVLLGDVAPGVGMETRLQNVNVMEGLCNDEDPVAKYASRLSYVMLIDGDWKGPYWVKRYPSVVDPRRRILHKPVLKWWIGVYPLGSAAKTSTSASLLVNSGSKGR
jgi:4-amino-4-deoxy-L-arabinose transferase-like glycosyltransferase